MPSSELMVGGTRGRLISLMSRYITTISLICMNACSCCAVAEVRTLDIKLCLTPPAPYDPALRDGVDVVPPEVLVRGSKWANYRACGALSAHRCAHLNAHLGASGSINRGTACYPMTSPHVWFRPEPRMEEWGK